MPFYDFKSKTPRTAIGQKIVEQVTNKVFKTVRPYLQKDFHILDIGAGNGEFAERCLKNNFVYTAVEVNEEYKNKLTSIGAKVISALVPPIPLNDNIYDYVHLSHLIEHMQSSTKALELVSEINRVLKPGGYLCIIAPDYLHSHSFFYDSDYTHSFVTTQNRVKMLLTDASYKIVFSRYLAGGQTGWRQWFLSLFGWIYNNCLYWIFQALVKAKIDSSRFGRTRGALARFVFILAQKV
ncbi:MAG: class I SAM-dependent methyltransferase [Candidatus Latescibacteria bacterium]|nr:class I SAM-dependent methyltransferase [Candidatus Latescibacterota bacterium]